MSRDRRSQLFRMGGWVTLAIGILTLLRSSDTMVDYTGHAAIICLMLALIARPVSRLWAFPLRYRRAFGVGAFILSVAHVFHMVVHSWNWHVEKLFFMLPQHQQGIVMGGIALLLMLPLAMTSFDGAQKWLGRGWRSLHLLSIPALILGVMHAILVGSHYLGALQLSDFNRGATVTLGAIGVMVLLIRHRWMWALLGWEKFYAAPIQNQRIQSDLVEAGSVGSKK
jgi:DMSO/TMAO reductase YedYZ heme-binding membrane subunit